MKIRPIAKDFAAWAAQVPVDGDLLFFAKRDLALAKSLCLPLLRPEAVHNSRIWSLAHRSWYGYALSRCEVLVWLPRARLEKLAPEALARIAKAQKQLGVPTLIAKSLLPATYSKKLLSLDPTHLWVSAQAWKFLTKAERLRVMRAWFVQNEIQISEGPSLSQLPKAARAEMKRIGHVKNLNRFVKKSGPNCLATAISALSHRSSRKKMKNFAKLWMGREEFWKQVKKFGYVASEKTRADAGDLMVISKDGLVVHAAYCLGQGHFFEKPGQDFYEPYRILKSPDWNREWPKCRHEIWSDQRSLKNS
jgi:hypothetical protein